MAKCYSTFHLIFYSRGPSTVSNAPSQNRLPAMGKMLSFSLDSYPSLAFTQISHLHVCFENIQRRL